MEDPFEDTEWNDILRRKGILPKLEKPKEEDREEVDMSEPRPNLDLLEADELDDLLNEDDDEFLAQYAQQRMKDMKARASDFQRRAKFGSVYEINRADWTEQVNKAGDGIWVIVHLYKNDITLCKLLNQHLDGLARKFPTTKFLKSVASVCIENYPDRNLPTLFVYREGNLKAQIIGRNTFKLDLKQDELEWCFKEIGAVESTMEENPTKQARDVISSSVHSTGASKYRTWDE